MGLSNTQYRDIMYKYDQLRLKNKRLVASRYEELYEKIPELRNIQNEIINLSTNQARMELLTPDEKLDEKAYRAKKDELINKKTELLLANGYPADFLSPIYSCKDCKDTGYIGNKPCHCLKQYEITSLYQNSNLADILEKENFDTFNPAFYDNRHIVENLSLTARENILRVKAVCLDFVKHFDTAYDNLIFYGETGVGKTFLTHCIAKELLDTSHTVVYLTSLQLFDILEKNKFYKTDEYLNNEQISYILNCELLIIDDLGTELANGFTTSQLYYFIEERHMNQKSTIISTNLSFQELRERYSERIFSRFTGYYNFYMIAGDDIRIKIAIS
jgi:replicative DNA helicase loader dnaI